MRKIPKLITKFKKIKITDNEGNETTLRLSKQSKVTIGESDFKNLIENYYYVDKTLLIKDFLDTKAKVTLFTRPRRFGKTLNMDAQDVF